LSEEEANKALRMLEEEFERINLDEGRISHFLCKRGM